MDSVFRLINKKNFLHFLAVAFCPKNLAVARKIMALPESGGGSCSPPGPPGSYAYEWRLSVRESGHYLKGLQRSAVIIHGMQYFTDFADTASTRIRNTNSTRVEFVMNSWFLVVVADHKLHSEHRKFV